MEASDEIRRHIAEIKDKGMVVFDALHGMEKRALFSWSSSVVDAYGQIYRSNKALVMDRSLLEIPVDEIKVALKIAFVMFAAKRSTDALEAIATGYMNLGRFQAIEREDKKRLHDLNAGAVPATDLKKSPGDMTEQEQYYMECFKTFNRYLGLVEKDRKALSENFGLYVQGLYSEDSQE